MRIAGFEQKPAKETKPSLPSLPSVQSLPLSPSRVLSAAPRAWDTTAAKRRQAERLSSVEHIVTKIIAGLEKNIRHGCTDDNVTRLVAEWAGPVGKLLRVEGVVTRAGKKTLRLAATHSAVIMELRGRLPALKAALKGTGIAEVRL
jgi:hypothetical protein